MLGPDGPGFVLLAKDSGHVRPADQFSAGCIQDMTWRSLPWTEECTRGFGVLAHPQLTKESPHDASGNYGLLD